VCLPHQARRRGKRRRKAGWKIKRRNKKAGVEKLTKERKRQRKGGWGGRGGRGKEGRGGALEYEWPYFEQVFVKECCSRTGKTGDRKERSCNTERLFSGEKSKPAKRAIKRGGGEERKAEDSRPFQFGGGGDWWGGYEKGRWRSARRGG